MPYVPYNFFIFVASQLLGAKTKKNPSKLLDSKSYI